jgi:hypothetical protein
MSSPSSGLIEQKWSIDGSLISYGKFFSIREWKIVIDINNSA